MTSTSAAPVTGHGVLTTIAQFDEWWADRHRAGRFDVTRIPFAELDTWHFDEATGNLGHDSGRFFTVEGLQVEVGGEPVTWQPIINQPEIGLLGIVVKRFGGVLHCLMQAKMEPGNVNTLQLSPTVQATRSNYTQVHRGATTRYLDLFIGPDRGEVLVDVLQSEQGAWFWRKRNRNVVVEITGDVPVNDDYRWLPLHLVRELMRVHNLVNMDARTVLSCMPFAQPDEAVQSRGTSFADALTRSYLSDKALHTTSAALSWFTEAKTMCDWSVRLIPVGEVRNWSRTEHEIADDAGRDFRIIGVRVEAGNREVTAWTQPLLEPRGQGLAIFLTRSIGGVLHVLVQARPEIGLLDLVEMGPTVQLLPGQDPADVDDPFVKGVATGEVGRIRYDTVLSEEGGRFLNALTRYRVVEVGDEFPVDVPPNFCWLTVRQLMDLLRHGHYLNIEARSLLACVHSLW
ncbi:NDP-hexose 2,3-dehydratase family protein [Kibdelosporangium phytohabitans]|uniref:NDP-hexose 2,3-dehydratase n=1 Tax=Kibdelosporangium phytohabitans TaxID=860235 RepID=A0A0N9I4J0_9PSEU|nr:NDP-hexose 2,3-dehydratase family protein [Kibdelosporangium phytohabitans]ALG09456.1 NDP-hexose 2,3-dehydratase [Kibdelosporangium phytohabitans]MBE1469254.1 oxidase EvaA [Kibdelosporangium phytohabitans]